MYLLRQLAYIKVTTYYYIQEFPEAISMQMTQLYSKDVLQIQIRLQLSSLM